MKVRIIDNLHPEDNAMLQALYSRSINSVDTHLKKINRKKSGKFMEKYYVGYGHKSIADCSSITLYIEGLSDLACKIFQFNPLYSGQQTSTRYCDLSKHPYIDPINSKQSKKILRNWRDLYNEAYDAVYNDLVKENPYKNFDCSEKVYKNTINAGTFDIVRSLLPVGIVTQFSWHTSLRNAYDQLYILRHNPLPEVSKAATHIYEQLRKKYPNSIPAFKESSFLKLLSSMYFFIDNASLNNEELQELVGVLNKRGRYDEIPYFVEFFTSTERALSSPIDFGCWRDFQRHRNKKETFPLIGAYKELHNWYYEKMQKILGKVFIDKINNNIKDIDKLDIDSYKKSSTFIKQYYYPMGIAVRLFSRQSFREMVYISELRSSSTVHPILRKIAQTMGESVRQDTDINVFIDQSENKLYLKRGSQNIEEK